jgi:hypothetical protein
VLIGFDPRSPLSFRFDPGENHRAEAAKVDLNDLLHHLRVQNISKNFEV